jgi:hypothetical protein
MTQAQTIGINNANMAFDQANDYDTIADAIASHWDNVQDTLAEEGILTDETFAEAQRAFDARVAQLRG